MTLGVGNPRTHITYRAAADSPHGVPNGGGDAVIVLVVMLVLSALAANSYM